MVKPFIATPVLADKATSPLADSTAPGRFGNTRHGIGVTLFERRAIAIVDAAAWPDGTTKTINAITRVTGVQASKTQDAHDDTSQIFQYAPNRWTIISTMQDAPEKLSKAVGRAGTVVDLSHGRSVFRMSGPKMTRVMAKLFAVDFNDDAFSAGTGTATPHHEISAQLYRLDSHSVDIVVFRSYARAFWHSLQKAAEETGYEIV